MLFFIVLVAAASHLAPQLSRRDIFFGVTVSPRFRDEPAARSIVRRYAVEIWGLALVAGLLVGTSPMAPVSGAMLLTQSVGGLVAFSRARHAARVYAVAPATIREAEIGPRQGLPGGVMAQLGPFLILAVAAVYLGLYWDDIPPKFPTHWNLAGKPDGWTSKSIGGVYRMLMVGLIACGMMLFTSYAVLHWTRLPRVTGSDGSQSRRVRRVNLVATLATEYLVAFLLAWASGISMFTAQDAQPRLPLVFRVGPFALVIIGMLAVRVMRRAAAANGVPVGDTTPDSCWFLGHLYFNRRDPTLFVEKRMGLGYTLNLGNPVSWLVMVVFVAALSVPLVFLQ